MAVETQDRKHSAFLHEGRIIRLIRDLKIRRRRWQRELQKSNRINNQKNYFARASRRTEEVHKRRRNFLSLSELEYGS